MSLNGTVWAPIGPSPIYEKAVGVDINANGQVTAIAINPNNPNVIYIGTAWGGVWLTRDGGDSWTPIFDRAPALGVGDPGALAIDPIDTNVLYVGTSSREGSQFSGEATQPSAGLFKSTDGGASWVRLGSGYPSNAPSNASIFFDQVITVVIVDPANTRSSTSHPNPASTFPPMAASTGPREWPPPGTCARWYWTRPRQPHDRILYAGITGSGVFQSIDGGLNWTSGPQRHNPGGRRQARRRRIGKVVVALAPPTSPPNPAGIQVIYATMVGRGGAPHPDPVVGLFLSTDQGKTWNAQPPRDWPVWSVRHQRRLQLPHGRRSRVPRRRGGRHHLFRHTHQARSTNAGGLFVGLTEQHYTPTRIHGHLRRSPAPSPSSIAAMTEGSSGASAPAPPIPAASTSLRSMRVACRPRCSTTSTSRGTRRRALPSALSKTTASSPLRA